MTMLKGNFKKKLLTTTFSMVFVLGFSHAASAQSLQTQTQGADTQNGAQADGFDLSIGESEAAGRYCGAGALNVYNVWINNGATQEAAIGAYDEYFNNCQCAKYGGSYCK